eukprot:464726-Amphidinium_carterae.1
MCYFEQSFGALHAYAAELESDASAPCQVGLSKFRKHACVRDMPHRRNLVLASHKILHSRRSFSIPEVTMLCQIGQARVSLVVASCNSLFMLLQEEVLARCSSR